MADSAALLSKRTVKPLVSRLIILPFLPNFSHSFFACRPTLSQIECQHTLLGSQGEQCEAPAPQKIHCDREQVAHGLSCDPGDLRGLLKRGRALRPASNHINNSQAKRSAQLALPQRPTATRTPGVASRRFLSARSA